MEVVFSIIPILFSLMSIAIIVLVLYLVTQAAVRNGINTSIVGKRMSEKSDEDSIDK